MTAEDLSMIFRKSNFMPVLFTLTAFCASSVCVVGQEDNQSQCRAKLSKKGVMIYDGVKQKRTSESNLEELWKETARDLITANQMGREDATAAAEQALNCLKTTEP